LEILSSVEDETQEVNVRYQDITWIWASYFDCILIKAGCDVEAKCSVQMTDIYNVQIHLGLAKTITSDQHMLAELSTILLQTKHYASSH